tara:strand:+ start:6831 stop:7292 length:462 start_codon:yes stop_codon:yes gene_type:complete
MNIEEKVKAQEAVEQCVERFYTIKKATALSKRNIASGVGVLDPEIIQVFYVAYLNLREEIEDTINKYIVESNLVPPIASAKLLEIYSKCLRGIRSYNIGSEVSVPNRLNYIREYDQPRIVSEEIASMGLISDEFLEDINSTNEVVQEEVEEFA